MPKVVAQYAPKMSERRRQRILAVIKQSGANLEKWRESSVRLDTGLVMVGWSDDVKWTSNDDYAETELIVHFDRVGHGRERAVRLASDLRRCGMVANVEAHDETVE
jgi:hypothetical protein